jgi:hypothetical protein
VRRGSSSSSAIDRVSEMYLEQRQKIKDEWTRNTAKVAGSDQTRDLQVDLAMFGDATFVNVSEP